MSTNHRPTYVALVAALRAEFNPLQLELLTTQLEELRYQTGTPGILRQAISDAWDVVYDSAPAEVSDDTR